MLWRDRQGNPVPGEDTRDKTLTFLYTTAAGKLLTKVMIRPWVSKAAGLLMDSSVSRLAIPGFIIGLIAAIVVSKCTKAPSAEVEELFDTAVSSKD